MVRDCLSTLEREGFISRKHGIGTIINQHVLDVKVRLDLEEEFLDMIRSAGYIPGVAFVRNAMGKADVRTAQKLGIKAGEDVVISVRLITADGAPAIYCVDHIARRSIVAKEYDLSLLDSPVFEFVEQYCGTEIYMDLSEISAVAAGAERADVFSDPTGLSCFCTSMNWDTILWVNPFCILRSITQTASSSTQFCEKKYKYPRVL